ncbi:hypothetical protein UP10_22365 [Bradyrhizobium sp. LTSPM299]|uniref:hypothetical protein n=1 Tax=Bradyrhizobium sp. LTSPM299 TaxID=1619233 RepID=UPI0005CB1A3F|nr:hypothetical protein [Bradyrhizobium sp. LTSPM299]KJC58663.1 hypothetical protein UP10_22365 [Bradyrhizobium sp. LTSPM299]
MIDGIERPPFVLDQGFWRGMLHLIVVAPNPSLRAYGIEISCEIYAAFQEMIYSVANHGGSTSAYDGGIYIKEAENSTLLKAYTATDPVGRKPRHFSFVGDDYCWLASPNQIFERSTALKWLILGDRQDKTDRGILSTLLLA